MHRLLLTVGAMVVLGACASGGAGAVPGKAFSLMPGESVVLPDHATLRYLRVSQDSRCPPGVQCIRAGDADVEFEFTPAGGAAAQVGVNTPESPVAMVPGWRLQLLSLEFGDSPRATVRLDAAAP